MSEAISSILQHSLQQGLEQQALKQPSQPNNKPSFESYLQKDENSKTQKVERTSGNEMQVRLEQLQNELSQKIQVGSNKINSNQLPPELLESKSRFGLLKEAYSKLGEARVSGGLEGRFIQVEGEYQKIEAIMKSDKNLTPGELLALQARLYQVSQHIEVMSKVVDQMSGGIKTILNTNV